MDIKKIAKRAVKNFLAANGYELNRKPSGALTRSYGAMRDALRGVAERRHNINTVIDVGASNGSWSSLMMEYYPDCLYLLVEAQSAHEKDLQDFSRKHENVSVCYAAAGETCGQVYFDATDPFGGQASYIPYESNCITVPVTTIDEEVKARKLYGPYLIKLDTHGFEVPIFKGAVWTLKNTDVVIVECYNFKIAPECLLFWEMCEYLKSVGFRCIDLVDSWNRPYDHSFWQMDLVFVKQDRPEFSYLHYK